MRRFAASIAAAQRDMAAAQRWPSLDAVGGYRHHLDDQRLVPARGPGEVVAWSSDIFSADLVVSMPLFTGGRIINEIRASDLLRRAAENRLVNVENPDNEHFIFDFRLASRSVVLERIANGKRQEWKNLRRVWELVRSDKRAFLKYIQDETNAYLKATGK